MQKIFSFKFWEVKWTYSFKTNILRLLNKKYSCEQNGKYFLHHFSDRNFAASDANDKNPKNVGLGESLTRLNFDVSAAKVAFIWSACMWHSYQMDMKEVGMGSEICVGA